VHTLNGMLLSVLLPERFSYEFGGLHCCKCSLPAGMRVTGAAWSGHVGRAKSHTRGFTATATTIATITSLKPRQQSTAAARAPITTRLEALQNSRHTKATAG
jgi:hypothetical protein